MEELLDDNLSLNNSDDSRLDSNSDRESLSLSAGIQRAMGTGGTRLKVSKSSSDSDDESSLLEELEIEEPGHHGGGHGGHDGKAGQPSGFFVRGYFIPWDSIKALFIIVVLLFAAILFASVKVDDPSERMHNIVVWSHKSTCILVPMKSELLEVGMVIPSRLDVNPHTCGEPLDKNETHFVITVDIDFQGFDRGAKDWITLLSWNVTSDVERKHYAHKFDLIDKNISRFREFQISVSTDFVQPVSISVEPDPLPAIARYRVLFSSLILLAMYLCIMFELIHRTIAAALAASLSLACLAAIEEKPALEEIISWIDFQTVGLLLGMMVMVGLFSMSGFFEYAAVKIYKLSRGNLWYLTILLSTFTMVMSAFLDNVTTILLVTPITLKLCRVLDIDPMVMILSEVVFSNIGGTTTIIGDPPNIIIANNIHVAKHVDFFNFSLHIMPPMILASLVVWVYIWWVYSGSLKRDPSLRMHEEVEVWKRTLAGLDADNPAEAEVRMHVLGYLQVLESKLGDRKKSQKVPTLEELEVQYVIKDWPLFVASAVLIGLVVISFFAHSLIGLELSLAWIAIFGACFHILTIMILKGELDMEEIVEKVEWGTLAFFAALFVLMEAITKLGLTEWIGNNLTAMIAAVPAGTGRLIMAMLLIVWISAFVSAFIDNIPYTATLVPVIVRLSESDLGLPLTPLVWALVFGTCLGGNGTLIGASANVVAVGLAEAHGYRISFWQFLKFGFPVLILTVFVASLWLILHALVGWW